MSLKRQHTWPFGRNPAAGFRFVVTVGIWLRWAFLGAALIETSYRVEFGSLSHILNTTYLLPLMVSNGFFHWKMRSEGKTALRWILAMGILDAAAITFAVSMYGGFDSRYFGMYYLAVGIFPLIFTSLFLVLAWTSLLAVVYMIICLFVGDGIDFAQHEEKELFYRLLAFYAVAVTVGVITRFERIRAREAVERERDLQRERIELSQTIHDTTAQSLYMIGIGIETAAEMADPANRTQIDKLTSTNALSKSVMWDLRHPIDAGLLLQGRKLGDVLQSHTETFTTITSMSAEFKQKGTEPALSDTVRSGLFSIAHNAMTNALRHSQATKVTVELSYEKPGLRISVSDDGIGLPDDYDDRSHGFQNMRTGVERLGGRLEVGSGPDGRGTTVSCIID